MVNPELVRQLLKELEAEKGGPVQLRVDTPGSERYVDGSKVDERDYFGRFVDRPVRVTRAKGLGFKFRDARQFSGNYDSLRELSARVHDFNLGEKGGSFGGPPKYQVTTEGIFADPVVRGRGYAYETKVADISLKLIE